MNVPTQPPRGAKIPELKPDREVLAQFISIVFKNASPNGYISLRSFPDKGRSKKDKAISIQGVQLGDEELLDITVICVTQAATWHEPAVFCPPVATFKNNKTAKTDDLLEGPCLSVECDQNPYAARSTLEDLLGIATAVVASGGDWTNPETGEIEPKLHLHWRLKKPTSTEAGHELLRELRELATKLVGGDGTNISIVHPIRWPGSWHRKGTPRLASIVATSENEIDLDEALAVLRVEAGDGGYRNSSKNSFTGFRIFNKFEAGDHAWVAEALAVIPNDSEATDEQGRLIHDWNYWNGIGMKAWAATGGSEAGRKAFHAWSAKAKKYDKGETDARWDHYHKYQPTKAGFVSRAPIRARMDLCRRGIQRVRRRRQQYRKRHRAPQQEARDPAYRR